jgi:hypothetical protein
MDAGESVRLGGRRAVAAKGPSGADGAAPSIGQCRRIAELFLDKIQSVFIREIRGCFGLRL